MKAWSTLALFVGLSAAAVVTPDQPYKVADSAPTTAAALVPEGAPADYHTDSVVLTDQQTVKALIESRRDASRKARGTLVARDFYECSTAGNPPRANDCNTVITNVRAANQGLVIAPGACLLFQFSTCWGFFCALCERLGTDTNFIGSQLSTVQTLCVNGGSAGTVVGEAPPQWEAGFIRSNGQLPNYAGEVCKK
ncbi:hypothetical protein NUW58_g3328 [Xylaria curta]|uniref:Uncharacterized protein n=1 Tax=Xylaria curta TaxID=42375 RepID=A0ACC1PCT9_9PEZI|nr:hypothetical protein NUW58_g3328 [Xylaria curta]